MSGRWDSVCCFCVLACCLASVVWADDAEPSKTAGQQEEDVGRQGIVSLAKGFQFTATADERPLVLQEEPALSYVNPTRRSRFGTILLWTLDGRPEVIGCFWYRDDTHWYAFQSLSDGPITGRYRGTTFWQSKTAGMTFQDVANVGKPAETSEARLLQMKEIARRFNCVVSSQDGSRREELRLMPRPICRYATKNDNDEVLDGAIFAFVQGTDPEVTLTIEAQNQEGETKWRYAFARQSNGGVEAFVNGEQVWTEPWSLGDAADRWILDAVPR